MLLGIVVAVLAVVAAASFVLALRQSTRAERNGELPEGRAGIASHVERLQVGARVDCDDRAWSVRGVQRIAAAEGARAWAAWHLEDKRQRALLAVDDADPRHVVLSVGAEDSAALDPHARPLRWRELEWRPLDELTAAPTPAAGEGERALWQDEEPVPPSTTVERVSFANPELPRRRLTFLREAGRDGWAVWIGDQLPIAMVDVYPPYAGAES
ncbi:DUF4178 domain-containing protein [Patulibacter defluvii]|uniref:DUF4178 domain-containing protein n=1 Tax=Patulibacter defluvii TaxID=3095358 RepID=UPI002A758A92|nr:DUF4178 domain-containing protein [Patulibacter sp. DM4]